MSECKLCCQIRQQAFNAFMFFIFIATWLQLLIFCIFGWHLLTNMSGGDDVSLVRGTLYVLVIIVLGGVSTAFVSDKMNKCNLW